MTGPTTRLSKKSLDRLHGIAAVQAAALGRRVTIGEVIEQLLDTWDKAQADQGRDPRGSSS